MKTITRNKLLQPVENILDRRFRKHRILNYYGPKGCGKSLLLDSLHVELVKYKNTVILGTFDLSIQSEYERLSAQLLQLEFNENCFPVLLIDNFDSLFYLFEDTKQFAENTVSDFINDHNGIVICTTMKAIKFERSLRKMRMYSKAIPIPSFSMGEIEEIALINRFSSKTLHKLSLSYPAAISWVIEGGQNSEKAISTTAANYFLGNIDNEFTRNVAYICCMVPFVDNQVMLSLLGEWNTQRNEIVRSIRDLSDASILTWDPSWRTYSFSNDSARRLCSKYFALEYEEYFCKINTKASEYFRNIAQETKAPLFFSLLSLYHKVFSCYPKFDTAFHQGVEWISSNLLTLLQFGEVAEIRSNWESILSTHLLEEEIVSFIGDDALTQLLNAPSLFSKRSTIERRLKVFLCHSSNDKLAVRELYQRLFTIHGIDPWLDENKILPGELWDIKINTAVSESDVVIVCISHDSINKEGYVNKEIKRALDVADEKPEETIFIIPLKLEECKVPARLSQWQWVNYFENSGFDKLIAALKKRANTLEIKLGSYN